MIEIKAKMGVRNYKMFIQEETSISPYTIVSHEIKSISNTVIATFDCDSLNREDLSNLSLKYADLSNFDLSNTTMRYTNLTGADLSFVDAHNADLSNSNLCGATLKGANLSSANLSGCVMIGAQLQGTNLKNTDLTTTLLQGADYDESTIWPEGFNPKKEMLVVRRSQ